jgi:hypothetical protein
MRRAAALLLAALAVGEARAGETVTLDTYVRAESDAAMKRYVGQGAFGTLSHERAPVPLDQQAIIRMNRDTLYSGGVFDLTSPVTITLHDAGNRFQSLQIVSQDHYTWPASIAPATVALTAGSVGTRYAFVIVRTFANPDDPADMAAAHAAQDAIVVEQAARGAYETPDWDAASLGRIRDALLALAAAGGGGVGGAGTFGTKAEVDPVRHLLGTAVGWGGNAPRSAVYRSYAPEKNDGATPYVLRLKDVPVDGFWSVTVYDAKGYIVPNAQNAYSFNSVTAKPDGDGGWTIRFGGDPSAPNFLPIMPGWNFLLRLYEPRPEVLDGSWTYPEPAPAS